MKIQNLVLGAGAIAGLASLVPLYRARRRRLGGVPDDASLLLVELVEDGDRRFIINPPLTLALRNGLDGCLYVVDEQLNLRARGASREELIQAIHRELPRVWDIYVADGVTPRDDGVRVARALRQRIRVMSKHS